MTKEAGMRTINTSQPTTRWHLSTSLLPHQWLPGSPWCGLTLVYLKHIIIPKIPKISFTFKLKSWLPPEELYSEREFSKIPVFLTPQEIDLLPESPYKSIVAAAMLAGSLTEDGIASSVLFQARYSRYQKSY